MAMQSWPGVDQVTPPADRKFHPRLAGIEADMEISDAQLAAWEVFAETFEAIALTIEAIETQVSRHFADRAPLLSEGLKPQVDVLSSRLRAARLLRAITEGLFQTFTPSQRQRADRLLLALCGGFLSANEYSH
jgi:hypothetical protein